MLTDQEAHALMPNATELMSDDPEMECSLYELDYVLWLDHTVNCLRSGDWEGIDRLNLIEELEALGRSERRGVASLLKQILIHLLLYQHWVTEQERNRKHWAAELVNFRDQLQRYVASQTLKNYAQSELTVVYKVARLFVERKTGLEGLPLACPYSLEQVLDEEFYGEDL